MILCKKFLFLIVLLVATASLFVTKCNAAEVELPLVQALRIAKDLAQAKLEFADRELKDLKSRVVAKEFRSAIIVESAAFAFQKCLYDLKLHAQLLLYVVSLFERVRLEALPLMSPFFISKVTTVSGVFLVPFLDAFYKAHTDCQKARLGLELHPGQRGEGLATEAYESFLCQERLLINGGVNWLQCKKRQARKEFNVRAYNLSLQFVGPYSYRPIGSPS